MSEQDIINDYNEEPVKYCARCYSLKIKYEESIGSEYCGECGCSDIVESSIYDWEKLFERRYHHKFVSDTLNIVNSPIFKAGWRELQQLVFKIPYWRKIVYKLYSDFPGGLGKEDSILLLFNKLIKDNRLDDLRHILVKNKNKIYGRAEENQKE